MSQQFSDYAQRMAEYRAQYDWRTGPHREASRSANTEASEFAKVIVQSFVVLHGGALVAFPTLLPLAGVELKSAIGAVIWIAITLTVGLVAATIAGLAGFFAWSNSADGSHHMIESVGWDAWVDSHSGTASVDEINEGKTKSTAAEKKAGDYFKWYGRWRTIGITAVLLSLTCFIAASVIGIYTVWHAPFQALTGK